MDELTTQWKLEVFDKGEEIDPHNELDWLSLCTGWALAKGMSPAKARDFARRIRYEHDLG